MTQPPDASPLEQMSDQELAQQLEELADQGRIYFETSLKLREAARRLRAASRLSSPEGTRGDELKDSQRHLEAILAELSLDKKAELMSKGLGLDPLILALRKSSPSSAPAATPAQPTYHHEPTCEKLHGGDCTCDPNRLGETHGPLDDESLGGERPATPAGTAPVTDDHILWRLRTRLGHDVEGAIALLESRASAADPPAPPAAPRGQDVGRDPIVMAADAARATCVAVLRRAIATTRREGLMPLTAEECLTILESFKWEDVPLPAAPAPASPEEEKS